MSSENGGNKRHDDPGFKMVVHNVDMLCWILKTCVDPYKDCTLDEIKDCLTIRNGRVQGIEQEIPDGRGGYIKLDTAFIVRLPQGENAVIYLNVEGQSYKMSFDSLAKRAVHYLSSIISMQKTTGARDPYASISRTFGVWLDFCGTNGNTIDEYRMAAKRILGSGEPIPIDLTGLAIVNIDGNYATDRKDFQSLVTAVFRSSMDDEKLRTLLTDTYKFRETESIIEGRNMMSMTERAIMDASNDTEDRVSTNYVVSVVRKLNLSVDEAFDLLSVPAEVRKAIRGDVEKALSS